MAEAASKFRNFSEKHSVWALHHAVENFTTRPVQFEDLKAFVIKVK